MAGQTETGDVGGGAHRAFELLDQVGRACVQARHALDRGLKVLFVDGVTLVRGGDQAGSQRFGQVQQIPGASPCLGQETFRMGQAGHG